MDGIQYKHNSCAAFILYKMEYAIAILEQSMSWKRVFGKYGRVNSPAVPVLGRSLRGRTGLQPNSGKK